MVIKEKNKELKRLKENFDTVKITNETLRKEVSTILKLGYSDNHY